MIRYLGTEDDVIPPDGAIANWEADYKNSTYKENESYLKMVEEKGLGHHVSPGEKKMMKKFFHDP